jgi:hypothetical protein
MICKFTRKSKYVFYIYFASDNVITLVETLVLSWKCYVIVTASVKGVNDLELAAGAARMTAESWYTQHHDGRGLLHLLELIPQLWRQRGQIFSFKWLSHEIEKGIKRYAVHG